MCLLKFHCKRLHELIDRVAFLIWSHMRFFVHTGFEGFEGTNIQLSNCEDKKNLNEHINEVFLHSNVFSFLLNHRDV